MDWPHSDKLVHFTLFGGLAGVVAAGLWRSNHPAPAPKRLFWSAAGFTALYGLSDEIHQLFVPSRSFDPLDLLADAVGATIFAGVFAVWTAPSVRAVQPDWPHQG